MKNLFLEYKNASQHLLKSKNIVWSFYSRRARIMPSVFGVVGVVFIYAGIISEYNLEKANSIEVYSYIIHLGIGISLLFISLFLFNSYYQLKRRNKEIFYRRMKSYQKQGDILIYIINENGISFENHDTKRHNSWEYYSSFKSKDDFIFIFSKFHDDRFPYEIIHLKPLDEDLVKDLKALLKEKLYERL